MMKPQNYDELYWSSVMILKSMKLVMNEKDYELISQTFFEDISSLKTVISHDELKKKLEQFIPKPLDVNDLMKQLEELRFHQAFIEILDLNGVINIAPLSTKRVSPEVYQLYHSNRKWLIIFALEMCELLKKEDGCLPENVKYVAFFEADKLARKISKKLVMKIQQKVVQLVVKKLYALGSTLKAPQTSSQTTDNLIAQLFDNTDYYLIPEFRHILDSELEDAEPDNESSSSESDLISDEAVQSLLDIKLKFQLFFEELAKYEPFSLNASKPLPMVYEVLLESHSFFKRYVFRQDVVRFFQHDGNCLVLHHDIPEDHENIGPYDIMPIDEYMDIITKRTTNPQKYMPAENDGHDSTSNELPVVSPSYQLCISVESAFTFWSDLLTKKLDRISFDKLDEVRAYINKCLDFFEPDKQCLAVVDYKKYRSLMDEWKEMIAEYLKNPGPYVRGKEPKIKKYGTGVFGCTTFSQCLFPELVTIYQYGDGIYCDLSEEKDCQLNIIAMMEEFPKAALILHNQKMCNDLTRRNEFGRYCTLDLILDPKVKKPKRCHVRVSSPLVETIWYRNRMMKGPNGGPVRKTRSTSLENVNGEASRSEWVPDDDEPIGTSETATEADSIEKELEKWKAAGSKAQRERSELSVENYALRTVITGLQMKCDGFQTAVTLDSEKMWVIFEQDQLTQQKEQAQTHNAFLQREGTLLRIENQDLTKENKQLRRKLVDSTTRNNINIEKLRAEVKGLKKELKDKAREAEGWEKNYKKVVNEDMMEESLKLLGIENPVEYYTKFIEQGNNQLKTAKVDLKKFITKTKVRNEKIRAERELIEFETTVEYLQKKAQMNLDILKTEPNCDKENLYKVTPYPAPFSPFINSKMKGILKF